MSDETQTNPQQAMLASLHRAIMSIGKVKKEGRNPMFDSTYATLESVLDVVNPALHAEGLVMSQVPGYDAAANAVTMALSFVDGYGNLLNYATSQLPLGKIYKKDGSVQDCNAQNATAAQTYLARTQIAHVARLNLTDDDGGAAVGYDARDERPKIDVKRPTLSLVRKEPEKYADKVSPQGHPDEVPAIDPSWDVPEETGSVSTKFTFKGKEWDAKTMSAKQLGAPTFSAAGYPEEFKQICKKELLKRVAAGDESAIGIVNQNS